MSLGCRWVEFDVRLTADDELVLLHDDRLERTTDGRGKVRRMPLSAFRCCDAGGWFGPAFAGEPVPTLAEAIAVLAELGLGANIEIKSRASLRRRHGRRRRRASDPIVAGAFAGGR